MADISAQVATESEKNPLERQRELMQLLSQETRHSIIQALLGHPEVLASAAEINHFVPSKAKKTVEEQLDVLVAADILAIYNHTLNKQKRGLPWKFYGFTTHGTDILEDFNYLKAVPMARAVHQKTRKPEKIIRHETAPRPPLPDPVRVTFRLNNESG
ncbi:ArsR family transcriptional regulator [Natronocalculus amylovorans]|uniref:ArsR family transcriptional regulator n=1 Tax=Natronocalculus amylovorans TaxID=2917812 RepID=A0AAE3K9F2_9EURY|nr:ArsR family transcriptional regulator [Natronocalculus amylovorans]MCL9817525.1 ArsR family transcriptional regulator [Natronocalculus amylovorans]